VAWERPGFCDSAIHGGAETKLPNIEMRPGWNRSGRRGGAEAHSPFGVPFLEEWDDSLAVQPRWRRGTNVWLKAASPERGFR